MLGWNDIRQRYRRSVLGPFWITISMAVFILLLGVIYSHIFQIDVKTYFPFLALGYIIWGFIAQTTGESFISFQESERIIRQIRLPYSILFSASYGGISSCSSTRSSSSFQSRFSST